MFYLRNLEMSTEKGKNKYYILIEDETNKLKVKITEEDYINLKNNILKNQNIKFDLYNRL